jgi:endogenous inhibitor of DNA gyrase (YacG/DUF329 family)
MSRWHRRCARACAPLDIGRWEASRPVITAEMVELWSGANERMKEIERLYEGRR